MDALLVVLATIATWRVTAILVYDGWTDSIRYKAKAHMLAENGHSITRLGRILSCFWCTSLFVAIGFAGVCSSGGFEGGIGTFVMLWLALSGGAILLNHLCRVNLYAERG